MDVLVVLVGCMPEFSNFTLELESMVYLEVSGGGKFGFGLSRGPTSD